MLQDRKNILFDVTGPENMFDVTGPENVVMLQDRKIYCLMLQDRKIYCLMLQDRKTCYRTGKCF